MVHDIHAIYDQGVLRPIEPLSLHQGARVRLRIEEEPGPVIQGAAQGPADAALEYDDSDWTPEEMRAVAERWLNDPEGWGAPGMEIYDELYGDKPTDHGASA